MPCGNFGALRLAVARQSPFAAARRTRWTFSLGLRGESTLRIPENSGGDPVRKRITGTLLGDPDNGQDRHKQPQVLKTRRL